MALHEQISERICELAEKANEQRQFEYARGLLKAETIMSRAFFVGKVEIEKEE